MEKRKDVREHKNHRERCITKRESASKRERESRGDDGAQRATDTVQQPQQEQQKAEGLGSEG